MRKFLSVAWLGCGVVCLGLGAPVAAKDPCPDLSARNGNVFSACEARLLNADLADVSGTGVSRQIDVPIESAIVLWDDFPVTKSTGPSLGSSVSRTATGIKVNVTSR